MAGDARFSRRPTVRIVAAAAAILLGAVGTLGWRWHSYVTASASPYDEVGIALNSRMPTPLRNWGCSRIAERFPRTVPPYGC